MTIQIGIIGYGNLGNGVHKAVKQQPDMELVAIFTRRNPESLETNDHAVKVVHIDEVESYADKVDVMVLCGGSATDLPDHGPKFAHMFNTVDSFDTHANIPDYFTSVDSVAQQSGKTNIISVGWDPGMFSLNRVMSEAILPEGKTYTFWGKGLSQGHSDAVRRVDGVKNGVQYTIPSEEVIEKVRNGENPDVSKSERHVRTCYIVPEEGADKDVIENTIKTMPNYFSDYETTVHFITEEDLKQDHAKMPHGGFVIRSGQTGEGNKEIVEFSLALESNPEFTASVITAYARAAYRMNEAGQYGAKTVYDVAPSQISPLSGEELRENYL